MAEVKFEITSDQPHIGKTLLGAEVVRCLLDANDVVLNQKP